MEITSEKSGLRIYQMQHIKERVQSSLLDKINTHTAKASLACLLTTEYGHQVLDRELLIVPGACLGSAFTSNVAFSIYLLSIHLSICLDLALTHMSVPSSGPDST